MRRTKPNPRSTFPRRPTERSNGLQPLHYDVYSVIPEPLLRRNRRLRQSFLSGESSTADLRIMLQLPFQITEAISNASSGLVSFAI